MTKSKLFNFVALLVMLSMILAACAPAAKPTTAPVEPVAPKPAETKAPAAKFKACQVTDTGGIDDKSFNATAWKGVQDAIDKLGIEGKYLESQQQTDYEKNLNAFIEEKCDIIITVGFLLGDGTEAAAKANPNQKFSIVDYAYDPAIPNVVGQIFNTDQAGFLAGYVAAAVSKTGKVGTFGGLKIPTVTVFMDGYAMGVKYYNEKMGKNVEVLGWDPQTQDGLFTGNFESTDDGRTMGETLMDEGADVIMPVAGPVGLGTAAAIKERGNAYVIGVDADMYLTAPEYKSIILTSVMKYMDVTTFNVIKSVMDGTFKGGVIVGTLENGGVGLAPFHDLESVVPAEVKAELDAIKADIIAGKIATSPGAEPAPEKPAAAFSVGVVLPTKDEPRWIQDETRFKDAFKAAGYDVQILFSQGDSAKEKANVEALIAQGVKVIIICPQDATAAAAAAQEARDAGIKVISYDRLIRETDAVDFYVTFDSIAVGEAQAQYLVDKASGKDNPLYLYAGAASDNNAFLFFEGAWNVLQPKIADGTFVVKNSSEAIGLQDKATLTRDEMSKIIGQITTEWKFDVAKNLAEANLTAATKADKGDVFILAPNDGTARAIADVFGADKDVTSFVVTGQDAEVASVQYIIDGKQSMTVLKDVRTLVADAIAASIAFLEGKTPEKTTTYNNGVIDVPAKPSEVVTVDRNNVMSAIIDSGYWPASDFTGLDTLPVAVAPTPEPPPPPTCDRLPNAITPTAGELGSADKPIVITFVPSGDTGKITTAGTEIADCLTKMTGLTYKIEVGTSFRASADAMGANKAQVGFLNTFTVLLAEKLYGIVPIMAVVRTYQTNEVDPDKDLAGTKVTFYKAQFIANVNSGINTLADLKGKSFCFVDPASTSGYIIPRMILMQNGIDPDKDLASSQNAGSHNNVAIAVYNGDCDAGVTYVDIRVDETANLKATYPDIMEKVKVFYVSLRIPNDGIQVVKEFPAEYTNLLVESMTALSADKGGSAMLKSLYNAIAYEKIEPTFYDEFLQLCVDAGEALCPLPQ